MASHGSIANMPYSSVGLFINRRHRLQHITGNPVRNHRMKMIPGKGEKESVKKERLK